MFIVLCFDNSKGEIRLIVKQIICTFPLAASRNITANNYSAISKIVLQFNLFKFIPPCGLDGRSDELELNILLSHFMLFH